MRAAQWQEIGFPDSESPGFKFKFPGDFFRKQDIGGPRFLDSTRNGNRRHGDGGPAISRSGATGAPTGHASMPHAHAGRECHVSSRLRSCQSLRRSGWAGVGYSKLSPEYPRTMPLTLQTESCNSDACVRRRKHGTMLQELKAAEGNVSHCRRPGSQDGSVSRILLACHTRQGSRPSVGNGRHPEIYCCRQDKCAHGHRKEKDLQAIALTARSCLCMA